jgi:hypothetical protein
MEHISMKRIISYFAAAAVLALPAIAIAQTTKTPAPGASGSAPGHTSDPKKNAPGQKMLDEPGKPGGKGGASEYAPGQQKDTTTTTKTPKK